MYNKITTLTEYLLQEEQKFEKATGSFTLLLNAIGRASKIIASHAKQAGLVDVIGNAGLTNVSGDEVKKLDVLSNEILVETLKGSKQAKVIASEEMDDEIVLDTGDYTIFFDPLDGSSNIDVNINIGTIFSIYHSSGKLLRQGKEQIAAGYIVYGPSVMFVYSCGQGVHAFTLDPSIGSFLLSHPNIKIPEEQHIYSINESYENIFPTNVTNYLKDIKKSGEYTSRYVGSMVADVHRTLFKGGLFAYPETEKKPHGHLRLMYEVHPLAYLIQQAGGLAFSGNRDPLTIEPEELHQRVPIVMGSKKEVKHYQSFL